jgi:hypothetical protein
VLPVPNRRQPDARCHHCDGCLDEEAQHALEECPAWAVKRAQLRAVIGDDLSLPTVICQMVESNSPWRAMASFCENILTQKEAAERNRENTSTLAIRRKRIGRRRLAYSPTLLQLFSPETTEDGAQGIIPGTKNALHDQTKHCCECCSKYLQMLWKVSYERFCLTITVRIPTHSVPSQKSTLYTVIMCITFKRTSAVRHYLTRKIETNNILINK